MIIKIFTDYAKADVNVFNGDIVKIKDEGKLIDKKGFNGDMKKVYEFKVELDPKRAEFEGETKIWDMNEGSKKVIMANWGKDSAKWIDKPLEAIVTKKLINGSVKQLLDLIPAGLDKDAGVPVIEEEN